MIIIIIIIIIIIQHKLLSLYLEGVIPLCGKISYLL